MCLDYIHLIVYKQIGSFLFYFLFPYMAKKALFFGKIFEIKFLMELHVLRQPESENHVIEFVSHCVYESTISTIQIQITVGSSNLLF